MNNQIEIQNKINQIQRAWSDTEEKFLVSLGVSKDNVSEYEIRHHPSSPHCSAVYLGAEEIGRVITTVTWTQAGARCEIECLDLRPGQAQ